MKLLRLNIIVFSFLLLSTISVNSLINPYGYYGDKQLMVNTFSLNLSKLKHLLDEKIKSQAIIYGSSNTLSMDPGIVLKKTGLKCYNYGVFQFTVEDLYCSVRALYDDRAMRPELVVICLDDWALADQPSPKDEVFKGAQNRLSYSPLLSRYLPDFSYTRLNWFRLKSSISYDQVAIALPEFYRRFRKMDFSHLTEEEKMAFFNDDGTRKKFTNVENVDITDSAEAGKYDVTAYLEKRHEYLKKFPGKEKGLVTEGREIFTAFSNRRLGLLESTLQLLNEKGCKVILNIMPLQPFYQQLIRENSNYDKRIERLKQLCYLYQSRYKNIILVKDNHDINNFGGKANYFFDENHLTKANSTLLLESLFKNLSADAF